MRAEADAPGSIRVVAGAMVLLVVDSSRDISVRWRRLGMTARAIGCCKTGLAGWIRWLEATCGTVRLAEKTDAPVTVPRVFLMLGRGVLPKCSPTNIK